MFCISVFDVLRDYINDHGFQLPCALRLHKKLLSADECRTLPQLMAAY